MEPDPDAAPISLMCVLWLVVLVPAGVLVLALVAPTD
jgi:hypothetical protein